MRPEGGERNSEFPFLLGPYRLDYLLGQGGMGSVFAGVHTETGESVAVKTVLSRKLSTVTALHQEISILSSIQHPGVIRLRETGTDDGLPWYAMDAVQGPSLRDVMTARATFKGSPQNPFTPNNPTTGLTVTGGFLHDESGIRSLEKARWGAGLNRQAPAPILKAYLGQSHSLFTDLFAQLSAAVAHLHRQGVRHGDLKPENVLLMGVAQPLLVDLGIASYSIAGREKLDLNPVNAGSMAYMAPEQLGSGHVDTRSDLYSLGCMMYEWLSGQHPSAGSDGRTMRSVHIPHVPTRLKLLVPDLSPLLESLVMRLIEKDPKDRPARIEEILAHLQGKGPSAYTVQSSLDAPLLFRSPFCGRTPDLQTLNERLIAAREGQGSITRVCGEQGLGKTRLLNELVSCGRAQSFTVLLIKKDDIEGRALANFASQLVASLVDEDDSLSTGVETALFELDLANIDSSLDLGRQPNLREGVLSAVAEAVCVRTRSQPILILVDDAEELDELSEELIEMLARSAPNHHLAIVCAQREFAGFKDGTLRLSPFDAKDIAEIARCMLSTDTLPVGFQEFVQSRSMGNPMLTAAWLRSAIFEGLLNYRPGAGWSVRELMPQELHGALPAPLVHAELARRRLAGLTPTGHRILEIASVLGRRFPQDLLANLDASEGFYMALGELLLAGVLESTDVGWLRFADAVLAESFRSRLSKTEELQLHAEAARWLEARVDSAPQYAEEYAEHLLKCDRVGAALPYFKLAAQVAAGNLRFRDSERLYQRALTIVEGHPEVCDGEFAARLNEALGDIAGRLKHGALATKTFSAALNQATDSPIVQARLQRKLAALCQNDREQLRQHLSRGAEALAAASEDDEEWLFEWIEIQLARMLNSYFEGDLKGLLEQTVSLGPTVEQRGSPRQLGSFLSQRAAANMRSNRYRTDKMISEDLDRAFKLQSSDQDHQGAATTRFLICLNGLCSLGQAGQSLELVRRGFEGALTVGRARDDILLQLRASTYLSMTLRRQGEVGACGRISTALLALEEDHPDSDYRGAALANLAWVSYRTGDFDRSRDLSLSAFRIWEAADSRFPFQWLALCPLIGAFSDGKQGEVLTVDARRLVETYLGDTTQCWLPSDATAALERLLDEGQDGDTIKEFVRIAERNGLL